jgi:polyferredoxin
MEKLEHRTLVEYTSMAEQEGKTVRRMRPRTVVYGGLLLALAAFGFTLASQRLPFEATVNRVPGSLYTVDPDGFVRNTYLVQITNNKPGDAPVDFRVIVEGIPDAEVIAQDVQLASTETRTLPLIVRVPQDQGLGRTTQMQVRVVAPDGEIAIPTTFKTGASVDSGTDWD